MQEQASILNVLVSVYRNYKDPVPIGQTTLLRWLQSTQRFETVALIRQTTDKKQRDKIKATLPAITPSGVFSHRNEESLIKHSGFICLDIDLKENEQIRNYADLKREMSNIKQVAYCGMSVSAEGYFVLIPIAFPIMHLQHFLALQSVFASFGIKVDEKCKDISRLRGYSIDPDAYYNHTALPFTGLLSPVQPALPKKTPGFSMQSDENTALVERLISDLEQNKTDITSDYNYWFAIGCNLASTFGEQGRNYFHRLSQFHPGYTPADCDYKFNHCLKKATGQTSSLGALINKCKDFNLYSNDFILKPLATETPSAIRHPQSLLPTITVVDPTNQAAKSLTSQAPKPQNTILRPHFTSQPQLLVDVEALEAFFAGISFPPHPITIPGIGTITNPATFIASHLATLRANNGNPTFHPFLQRLETLQKLIT